MASKAQSDPKEDRWLAVTSVLDQIASHDENSRALPFSVNSFLSATGSLLGPAGPTPLLSLVSTSALSNEAAPSDVTPSAPGGKDLDIVIKMLAAAEDGPAESVKQGGAPMPPNIGIVPPSSDADIAKNYNYLIQMSSLSALYTGIWNVQALKKRGRTEPYNISDSKEAAQAFADLADSGFQAMVGPLASFYNLSNAVVNTYQKSMRKTEVHLEFLTNLFKPYNLVSNALTQLDGILTTFVDALRDVKIESSGQKSTVNQTIRINQIVRTNVTGDDANPYWIYVPKTRIVYLKIDNETWKLAVGKSGSDEGFNFKMETTVIDGELNVEKYLKSKEKLDKVFEYVTGLNLQAYGEKTNPPPVNSQS